MYKFIKNIVEGTILLQYLRRKAKVIEKKRTTRLRTLTKEA